MVGCIGDKKPRFLISPTIVEFDKKIISGSGSEKSVPDSKEIVLTNLGHEPLPWYIDDSAIHKAGSIFLVKPNKGYLEYSMKAYIKIYFDP